MRWLEFISEMTKALAWPAAVVVIIMRFGKQIRNLIPDLRRLKAGTSGVELEWERRLNEAKAELALPNAVSPPGAHPQIETVPKEITSSGLIERTGISTRPAVAPSSASRATNFLADIEQLADVSPSAAVVEAYRRLEQFIKETLRLLEPDTLPAPTARKLIDAAVQAELLTPAQADVFHDLRALRNEAAHGPATNLTKEQAIEFGDLARQLIMSVLLASSKASAPKGDN